MEAHRQRLENLSLSTPTKTNFLTLPTSPDPSNGGFPPSPTTPRGASVWAAQTVSSQTSSRDYLSAGANASSGLRTPSGYEHLDFGAAYFEGEAHGKRIPRSFEWEQWSDYERTPDLSPSSADFSFQRQPDSPRSTRTTSPNGVLKRRLGPNEISYYLSSRGAGPSDPIAGVNDMYLHLGFTAPASLVTPERIAKIWTELRLRHTLLTCTVEFESYEDVRFVHKPCTTYEEALAAATENLVVKFGIQREEVLDNYLNGPRTLSDEKLACMMVTSPEQQRSASASKEETQEFDLWLFATHFLGDGMALHTTANEFFELLQGKFETLEQSNSGLEWNTDSGDVILPPLSRLPPAQETRISTPDSYGRFAWAAARVEFQKDQDKLIGGQVFPRAKLGSRHTVVPTHGFTVAETSAIIKKCKEKGVTIAHAMFALANLAHMKVTAKESNKQVWSQDKGLPMMLYSALNLRPNMCKGPEEEEKGIKPDFFHLVIGYYNVILPTFSPRDMTPEAIFWRRARETKAQTLKAIKSPFLCQRSKLMSLERERRAIGFEKEDERRRKAKAEQQAGRPAVALGFEKLSEVLAPAVTIVTDGVVEKVKEVVAPEPAKPKVEKAPSLAFLGVSMLGNLDFMYKHADFPSIKLHSLTTGSRQRPGAMLMFAYTLAGRLFISLGYDKNGYAEGVVEEFYDAMRDGLLEVCGV